MSRCSCHRPLAICPGLRSRPDSEMPSFVCRSHLSGRCCLPLLWGPCCGRVPRWRPMHGLRNVRVPSGYDVTRFDPKLEEQKAELELLTKHPANNMFVNKQQSIKSRPTVHLADCGGWLSYHCVACRGRVIRMHFESLDCCAARSLPNKKHNTKVQPHAVQSPAFVACYHRHSVCSR